MLDQISFEKQFPAKDFSSDSQFKKRPVSHVPPQEGRTRIEQTYNGLLWFMVYYGLSLHFTDLIRVSPKRTKQEIQRFNNLDEIYCHYPLFRARI